MFQLFSTLFDLLEVNYTSGYLRKLTDDVPYKDSMYGICIVLNKYNVSHQCIKYVDTHAIKPQDAPFIAIYRGQFVLVININDNGNISLWANGQIKEIHFEDFRQEWNGVAILIHADKNAQEEDYKTHKLEQQRANFKSCVTLLFATILITAGLWRLNHIAGWKYDIVFAINLMGLFISFLLLQKQLHIPNKVADKICSLSRGNNCADVTESKGATVLGLVKLGEVGFGFFMSNIIIILCFPETIFWLGVYSVVVLPFSFWSLWYQKYKVRKWCPLCLLTLAIMWGQAFAYTILGSFNYSIVNFIQPFAIGIVYVIFVLITNQIMNILRWHNDASTWHSKYEELKGDDTVIEAFMREVKPFDISEDNCSSLYFGNANAKKIITVFSNPFCGPCGLMHRKIKSLPLNCIRVQYVMTYFSEEKSKINKAIIAAYQQLGADATWRILSDWFSGGQKQDFGFFAKFNLDIDTPDVETEFRKQREWSKDERLYGTPIDLINGREIIWPYTIDDYIIL